MSIRMFKALFSTFILILSFLLASCGEGERKLVTVEAEPEDEPSVPLVVHAGGVKGPLVNAKVSFYKVDLEAPDYRRYVSAVQGFYRLLDEHGVTLVDGEVLFDSEGMTEEEALSSIKNHIAQTGYVSELPMLMQELLPDGRDDSEALNRTLANATVMLDEYLADETNALLADAVLAVRSRHASVKDLYNRIDAIPTLLSEVKKAKTLGAVSGLIAKYRAREVNAGKLAGFDRISERVSQLRPTTLSSLLSQLRAIEDAPEQLRSGAEDAACEDYSAGLRHTPEDGVVAANQLSELIEDLEDADDMLEAETILQNGWRMEGNDILKGCLSSTISSLINLNDAIELIASDEALYLLRHDLGATAIANASSLDDLVEMVQSELGERARPAIESALKSRFDKDVTDTTAVLPSSNLAKRPANFLKEGMTGQQARYSADLGDYRGFVYMVVESVVDTIDINNGQTSSFPVLESIFNTDDIQGYGDNSKEDLTRYFLQDGQKARDQDGNLIMDKAKLQTNSDALEVFPSRFATPLTSISLAVFRESVSDQQFVYNNFQSAIAQSGSDESVFIWNHLFFNDILAKSSDKVWQSFGVGDLNGSLFNSVPVFTREMEWDRPSQISSARYRTYSESFAALAKQLADDLGVTVPVIISALASDLADGEIDGKHYENVIPLIANYAPLHLLAIRHPDVVPLVGTLFNVDDSLQVMKSQLSRLEPEAAPGKFDLRTADLVLSAPAAGIDSDGDGVLENSDDFPSDPVRQYDLAQDYAGLWSVSYDASRPFVMPFDGRESIMFSRQQAYGLCATSPCFSVGNNATPVTAAWSIVAKPQNSDIEVTTAIDDEGDVGAEVSVSTPGSYVLKGEFTSVVPERTQTVLVPITVIDPRLIELRFTPDRPDVGEPVLIEFKVTDDLCRLVDCTSLNRSDATDDYLPVAALGQNFSVIWEVDKADEESQGFRQVYSRDNGSVVVNDLNTGYGDRIRARVMFHSTAGGTLPVHFQLGSTDVAVGTPLDYDNDGVANELDSYPEDGACWRSEAGTSIEDDAVSGGMRLVCNDSLMADVDSERMFVIQFGNEERYYVNEEWYYHPDWEQFLRKDLNPDPDLFRSPILFKNLKDNPADEAAGESTEGQSDTARLLGAGESIVSSQENNRVYFVLDENELVYFDAVKGELYKFWKPENPAARITGLNLIQRFVVASLEQNGSQSFVLLNESGKEPEVTSEPSYPDPGHELSVQVDSRPMSVLADYFDFSWQIARTANDGSIEFIPAVVSDDGLRVLAGQTRYGDRVTLTVLSNIAGSQQAVFTHPFYVLGADGFKFKDKFNDLKINESEDENSKFIAVEMIGAEFKDKPADSGVLSVNWYKNGRNEENYDRLIFTDLLFPFQLAPRRHLNGDLADPEPYDIITADIQLKLGREFILLKRLITVVMPDPTEFKVSAEDTNVEVNGRDVRITVNSGIEENDEFYRRFFAPYARWFIDDEIVSAEEAQGFPVFERSNVKYGQTITLIFDYKVGEERGETGAAFTYKLDFEPETSTFDISPKVPHEGEELSFDYAAYTQESLIGYQPRWVINGVVDQTEIGWTYPANKLQYGDKVELHLDRPSIGSESEAGFNHVATVYVGINSGDASDDRSADLDSDGDGIPNQSDYFRNDPSCSDLGEGQPDDRDGDGVADLVEIAEGTNPNNADTDNDELSDGQERAMGSNPNEPDSDDDGYSDYTEYFAGTNPNSNLSPGSSIVDLDKDGLSNDIELSLGLFVNRKDSDGDGLWDGFEVMDPDGDGIANWSDADNDGIPDNLETSLIDTDGDGTFDVLDADSDNDGLSDGAEVYITKTNRLEINSDADELDDGVEVVLVGSNPTVGDTDNNGIPDDKEEYAQGVGNLPDGLLRSIGDLDEYEYGKTKPSVNPGTCYASWLDRQNTYSIVESEHHQMDADSQQRLLFSHYGWNEVLLFDANQNQFAGSVFEPGVTQNVTATAFDAGDINRIFLGYADGTVKRLDRGVPNERDQDRPVFNVGSRQEILSIKSKPGILLVETVDQDNPDQYRHYLFDADDSSAEPVFINVAASYRSAIWRNLSTRDSLLLVNSETGQVFEESIPADFSDTSQFVSSDNPEELMPTSPERPQLPLSDSFYLDAMGGVDSLRFTSGQQFNLTTQQWTDSAIFGIGLYHQDRRVETSYDNAQITLVDGLGSSGWTQITQPENDAVISMFPVGSDVLIISKNMTGPASALGFSIMAVGDSDGDGLPGWWEEIVGTSDSVSNWSDVIPGTYPRRTYGEVFQEFKYPGGGIDSDDDGLLDSDELLLGTNPYKSDTDGDGLSDQHEVSLGTNPLERDSDGNGINDGNEDFDDDGLTNHQELLLSETNPLQADTDENSVPDDQEDLDGDGLSNYQEVMLTLTDPLLLDTDNDGISDDLEDLDYDGLTNLQEVAGSEGDYSVATNPLNSDSDGDRLLDGDEVFSTNTNPMLVDTDNNSVSDDLEDIDLDNLSNFVELYQTATDVNAADSDSDGVNDDQEDSDGDRLLNGHEVNLLNLNAGRIDTDRDGITDDNEDYDRDRLTNYAELYLTLTSPILQNTDGDLLLDPDEDADSDGLTDLQEVLNGTCLRFIVVVCPVPADSDSDGLSDYLEVITHGTNPLSVDTDADGLTDLIELTPFDVDAEDDQGNPIVIQVTSDPTSADGDGDGLSDYFERLGSEAYPEWRTNPNNADTDGDELSDYFEWDNSFDGQVAGANTKSSPNQSDTDGDELTDYEEVRTHTTNPAEPDTDFDGISDYDEIFGSVKTNPKNFDTDNDGLGDGDETLTGTNPVMQDSDNDKISDGDEDSDGDGLTDAQELYLTLTRFDLVDSDGDGIDDDDEDVDEDGLTALQEMYYGTDPRNSDTDGDNVFSPRGGRLEADKPDLSDGGEILLGTNPLLKDTDDDELDDNDELWPSIPGDDESVSWSDPTLEDTDRDGVSDNEDLAPRVPDQDFDLLLDGVDGGTVNSFDADEDGLLDGVEDLLGTDFQDMDSDLDGLDDADEVWVFALNADGSVYGHGPDTDGDLVPNQVLYTLNSRPAHTPPVLLSECFGENINDCHGYEVIDIRDKLRASLQSYNTANDAIPPDVRLFIRKFSEPTSSDSDADGLHDYTEVRDLSQINLTTIDPTLTNSQIFPVSDPMNPDTDGNGVRDGDEDYDGDYLRNQSDQASLQADSVSVEHSYIRIPDRDADGIPDGIEVLIFGSNPGSQHSDDDGLTDGYETDFEQGDVRQVAVTQQCNVAEVPSNVKIRLDDIAGRDYCVTIRMISNPVLFDSDYDGAPDASMDLNNDGINEQADAFKLDPACWKATDGFEAQCYASWMASQVDLPQIRSLNDSAQGRFEAGFYGRSWDKLVRYNYLDEEYLPHIEVTEALADFAYSDSHLYQLTEDGDLSRMPLIAGGSVVELGNVGASGSLQLLSGYLLVQTAEVLVVYRDNNGVLEQTSILPIGRAGFDVREGYYDEDTEIADGIHRLYAIGRASGAVTDDIGYLVFNSESGEFEQTEPQFSGSSSIRGPIAKALDAAQILTGSGHRFSLDLSTSSAWSVHVGERTFGSFRHYLANADHETIVVDFSDDSTESGPGRDGISNGLLAVSKAVDASSSDVCESSQNRFLNPLHEPKNKVLALLPVLSAQVQETFAVIRKQRSIDIVPMLLTDDSDTDSDGAESPDGMSSLYELYYGLDPLSDSDRFGDADGDSLTNIEEFQCATNPNSQDSDEDLWFDDVEILNGTSPTNRADH